MGTHLLLFASLVHLLGPIGWHGEHIHAVIFIGSGHMAKSVEDSTEENLHVPGGRSCDPCPSGE